MTTRDTDVPVELPGLQRCPGRKDLYVSPEVVRLGSTRKLIQGTYILTEWRDCIGTGWSMYPVRC